MIRSMSVLLSILALAFVGHGCVDSQAERKSDGQAWTMDTREEFAMQAQVIGAQALGKVEDLRAIQSGDDPRIEISKEHPGWFFTTGTQLCYFVYDAIMLSRLGRYAAEHDFDEAVAAARAEGNPAWKLVALEFAKIQDRTSERRLQLLKEVSDRGTSDSISSLEPSAQLEIIQWHLDTQSTVTRDLMDRALDLLDEYHETKGLDHWTWMLLGRLVAITRDPTWASQPGAEALALRPDIVKLLARVESSSTRLSDGRDPVTCLGASVGSDYQAEASRSVAEGRYRPKFDAIYPPAARRDDRTSNVTARCLGSDSEPEGGSADIR